LSIIEAGHIRKKDSLCEKISKDIEKTKVITVNDYIQFRRPSGQQMSRDSIAIEKGLIVPPHIEIEAKAFSIEAPYKACSTLQKYLIKLSSHLENVQKISIGETRQGSNIFVGHGKSALWREIKDFMTDRLGLPVDEFNRVPVAGITNVDRLKQMLDQAAIAFLVMTAEDEQADGAIRARQNVIHEVGLFQGRLGFTKAIVILEEGCEEFSNIQGLGQIRFPKGQVSACYEEIRLVLEREGLLGEDEESIDN
jgi:predicted nucleotide-binding protein